MGGKLGKWTACINVEISITLCYEKQKRKAKRKDLLPLGSILWQSKVMEFLQIVTREAAEAVISSPATEPSAIEQRFVACGKLEEEEQDACELVQLVYETLMSWLAWDEAVPKWRSVVESWWRRYLCNSKAPALVCASVCHAFDRCFTELSAAKRTTTATSEEDQSEEENKEAENVVVSKVLQMYEFAVRIGVLSVDDACRTFSEELLRIVEPDKVAQPLATAMRKRRTKEFYAQRKFNLLRENSEGFAKLVVALSQSNEQEGETNSTAHDEKWVQDVMWHVGAYSLAPMRVVDLLLVQLEDARGSSRSSAESLSRRILLALQRFPRDYVVSVMGHRLYQMHINGLDLTEKLMQLCVFLVERKLVRFNELYIHMQPSDEALLASHSKAIEDASAKLGSRGTVSFGSKSNEAKDAVKPSEQNQKLAFAVMLHNDNKTQYSDAILTHLGEMLPYNDAKMCALFSPQLRAILEPLHAEHSSSSSSSSSSDGADVDVIVTLEAGFRAARPVLTKLGGSLHYAPDVFVMLCELLATYMKMFSPDCLRADPSETNMVVSPLFTDMLLDHVLPVFCFFEDNSSAATSVWHLFKPLSYQNRYFLYGLWRDVVYASQPALVFRRAEVLDRVNYIKRRLSTKNVATMSPQVALHALHNPLVALPALLETAQNFVNLIVAIVESFEHLTPMGFDVLNFVFLTRVSSFKNKFKEDGIHEAGWFQNLCSFAGRFYSHYPSTELQSVMQFVCNQLSLNSTTECMLLKELLFCMVGIEVQNDVRADFVEALSGGPVLRERVAVATATRSTSDRASAGRKVLRALCAPDNNLLLPLVTMVAQIKEAIVFSSQMQQLKIGNLQTLSEAYDKNHSILLQLVSFMARFQSDDEAYSLLFPSLKDFVVRYRVSPADAFLVLRRALHCVRTSASDSSGLPAPLGTSGKASTGAPSPSPVGEAKEEATAMDVDDEEKQEPVAVARGWDVESKDVQDVCRAIVQDDTLWTFMSHTLYATFWQLTCSDLDLPRERYRIEREKLGARIGTIADGDAKGEELRLQLAALENEEAEVEQRVATANAKIVATCASFFVSSDTEQHEHDKARAFLLHCLLPRARVSVEDAVYCARFINMLRRNRVPHFLLESVVDTVCDCAGDLLGMSTEAEIFRLARFWRELLAIVLHWGECEASYELHCRGRPCVDAEEDWQGYRAWSNTAVQRFLDTMISAMQSKGNRLLACNAVRTISSLADVYPVRCSDGNVLLEALERVMADPDNENSKLRLLASSCCHILLQAGKYWSGKPLPEKEARKMVLAIVRGAVAQVDPEESDDDSVSEEVEEEQTQTAGRRRDEGKTVGKGGLSKSQKRRAKRKEAAKKKDAPVSSSDTREKDDRNNSNRKPSSKASSSSSRSEHKGSHGGSTSSSSSRRDSDRDRQRERERQKERERQRDREREAERNSQSSRRRGDGSDTKTTSSSSSSSSSRKRPRDSDKSSSRAHDSESSRASRNSGSSSSSHSNKQRKTSEGSREGDSRTSSRRSSRR